MRFAMLGGRRLPSPAVAAVTRTYRHLLRSTYVLLPLLLM